MHWIFWLLGAAITAWLAFFSPTAYVAGLWHVNATRNASSAPFSNCTNIFTRSGNSIASGIGGAICSGESWFASVVKGFGLDPFHVLFVVAFALAAWFLVERFILHGTGDWILKLVIIVILLVLLGVL